MQQETTPSSAQRNCVVKVFLFMRLMYFPRSQMDYLLRPPPERPPPCEAPRLDAPRAPLACALALLDAPPKALEFRDALLLLGICRLPTLFPPPLPRFAAILLAPPLARFAPVLAGRAAAFEPDRFAPAVPRLFAPVCLVFAP